MEKLKVLVVDDSAVYRRILTEAVEATGLGLVQHAASNGVIALERLAQKQYDIVLLDVMMPEMDGIETLRLIKKDYPGTDVIMISGIGEGNVAVTVEALEIGALDFIVKPSGADASSNLEFIKSFLQSLFTQIQLKKCAAGVSASDTLPPPQTTVRRPVETTSPPKVKTLGFDIVLIAASTGGPKALEVLCGGLPANLAVPVLIVQHMPPDFTRVLAESLDKKSAIKVNEGRESDPILPGRVVIAPGGHHLAVKRQEGGRQFLMLDDGPTVNGVKPAADVLFKSAAAAYRGMRVLAVVLTGMGNDGTQGVADLKQQCRCYCLTQNETSCVVYGMPKRVLEAGLSDESLDIREIAERIRQLIV